uniref:Uncharacterized protein n=1 Tax=Sphaerodactylus townsendi TaxID=933632 RepID=A0ACB8FX42_9SAUR
MTKQVQAVPYNGLSNSSSAVPAAANFGGRGQRNSLSTMLSLSSMKDGAIVPSEEDRKKLLTQMKVKTTLRSDKSWIQKKSDSEEEKNHSPLHSPLRSRKTSERASISPKVSPLNHRAVFEELSSQSEQPFPVAKQPPKKSHHTTSPSGYLIRGVFTKTVDKNAPSNNVSNGLQKSAKNASSTLGYKMSTEDYKKLAPYTVKRDTAPDHIDPPVSPDEQQKRVWMGTQCVAVLPQSNVIPSL